MRTPFPDFVPAGVIPATLMAFDEDLAIDERETRRHLGYCAKVDGVVGLTVNGHASEVHACSLEEQERALAFSLDEVGDLVPLVCGIYAESSLVARHIAAMAERNGASALLVFPAQPLSIGGQQRPELAIRHFSEIAEATSLPLICFQYPMSTGLGYHFDTLLELFDRVPTVRAVKDWCGDPVEHERHIRTFQSLSRPVNVLSAHSAWLMSSLSMGANGILSGAGSVIADLQVEMFRAIKEGDLQAAQAVNDRMYPIQNAFYASPILDMHNRMKEALVMLGRLDRAVVRPPLFKLDDAEIEAMRHALVAGGLLERDRLPQAAE